MTEYATKKEISEYYYISQEVEMWQNHKTGRAWEHVRLAETGEIIKSGNRKEDSYIKQCKEIESAIEKNIKSCMDIMQKIKRTIDSINDTRIKLLISERCINCKTWEQVAATIYFSIGTIETADGVRQAFNRTFDKDGNIRNKYVN